MRSIVRACALYRGVAVITALLLTPLVAMAQSDTEQFEFDIAAQPLTDALVEFSLITGRQVTGDAELMRDERSTKTTGRFTPDDALIKLLESTGLSLRIVNGRNYALRVADVAAPPPAQAIDPKANTYLEEVYVYGLRSTTRLLDVTSSLAVVSGEEIEREPLADLNDVLRRVPGVVTSPVGNQTGFAIRGVNPQGPAGGTGPTTTVFLDDSPLDNSNLLVGPLGAWDLQEVEVFRGPQSTNLGRNTLAGAIYVRTRDPEYEWDGKARLEVGDYGQRWGALAGGGGLIDNKLAFRISADYRETDGFNENVFLDEDADATRLWNTRLKLRFDPREDLSIISTTSYSENRIGNNGVRFENPPDAGKPDPDDIEREIANNEDGIRSGESFLQTVNLSWQINDRLALLSITSYQDSSRDRVLDADNTPEPTDFLDTSFENTTFTQELRLSYQNERLRSTLGVYYAGQDGDFSTINALTLARLIRTLPLPPDLRSFQDIQSDSKLDSYAIYVDGEFQISSNFDLLFGLRYDNEDTEEDSRRVSQFSNVPPLLENLFAPQAGEVNDLFEASYDAWLPKLGIRYTTDKNWTLAFVVQRAYRAGGAIINNATGELAPFDPEFLWNYEASSRAFFLDNRLTWSANVYYSDWTDQQVSVPLPPPFETIAITENAGKSELYGLETELRYNLSPELTVYGSAAFTYGEFIEFEEFDGNRFPNAPRRSGNAGIDYFGGNGLFGGIDLTYRDSVFGSPGNNDDFIGESFLLVNARIGYRITDSTRITALATNLFDEEYFVSLNTTGDISSAVLGDPRTIAIRLDMSF
ncbi:MAG: TonB-dependent receptor [Pseudomonadota bacterium]